MLGKWKTTRGEGSGSPGQGWELERREGAGHGRLFGFSSKSCGEPLGGLKHVRIILKSLPNTSLVSVSSTSCV